MIQHKLSITKDPDTSDWVICLTVKGQDPQEYYSLHPHRVYEPGTDENAWLRIALIRAQVAPVLAKDAEQPDPNKVPDWVWKKWAPKDAKIAVVQDDSNLWFGSYASAKPTNDGGWYGIHNINKSREYSGAWIIHVNPEDHGLTFPDWTKSLTKRPEGV